MTWCALVSHSALNSLNDNAILLFRLFWIWKRREGGVGLCSIARYFMQWDYIYFNYALQSHMVFFSCVLCALQFCHLSCKMRQQFNKHANLLRFIINFSCRGISSGIPFKLHAFYLIWLPKFINWWHYARFQEAEATFYSIFEMKFDAFSCSTENCGKLTDFCSGK